MKLSLAGIRTDGGTQPRAEISVEMVERYQEEIEGGATFPPLIVFYDGTNYWLADGFHRYRALRAAAKDKADVEVKQGTQRDAILFSVGANAVHGLPRTNADKRRAVEVLFADSEWSAKSDRWIAEQCAVSAMLVGSMRTEKSTVSGLQLNRKTGKDGKIRRAPKPPVKMSEPLDAAPEPPPSAPVRVLQRDEWSGAHEARIIETALCPAVALAESWPAERSTRLFIDALRALADRLEGQEEEKACRATN